MASIGSSVLPVVASQLATPSILNYPLALANTEYAVAIPLGAKKFTLQLREACYLKVAGATGDIAADLYFSVFPGGVYNIESASGAAILTLYVQPSKPSQVLELWYWS